MVESVHAGEDYVLIERARRRDLAAFERLVTRYSPKVYGLAVRMMGDPSDAEEILQESFLSAWQELASFRGDSAFGSWLYRICANFCLMRLRHKKVEVREAKADQLPGPSFDSDGALVGTPSCDWTGGPEEKALDSELRRAIERATAGLSAEHRAIFLLKDIDGLSYEEISEALSATIPAVKSRLHRARLALREAIEEFYREPRMALELSRGAHARGSPPRRAWHPFVVADIHLVRRRPAAG
jgi:RNA polymerase sigma-70 factor (ECF subfamily)